MLISNTPVETYREFGLDVKREDLSCPPPGPPFSKARGVWAHLKRIHHDTIGVLDTYHSQAGHAVAAACKLLKKRCINYYPEFKYEPGPREPQLKAEALGAELVPLAAGRSAILFHAAKAMIEEKGGYMMPNALKLDESVRETAREVPNFGPGRKPYEIVIVPASSGTIAAGVIAGFVMKCRTPPAFVIHMGYTRSKEELKDYILSKAKAACINGKEWDDPIMDFVDEGYGYKDKAKDGPNPLWPCSPYYDLKAFRWWMRTRHEIEGANVLFWNIG
jgi:hypothetical protein